MSIAAINSPSVTTQPVAPAPTAIDPAATTTTAQISNNSPWIAAAAVSLSGDAGVVATLGGAGLDLSTYNAAGLLNTIAQAGTSSAAINTATDDDTQAPATQPLDQSVLDASSSASAPETSTSGIYNGAGVLQTPSDTSSNWASLLKANPGMSANAIADSFAQGVIGSIQTTA